MTPEWIERIRERHSDFKKLEGKTLHPGHTVVDMNALLEHCLKLREALEFYADANVPPDGSFVYYNGIDEGVIALKALQHKPEGAA